MGKFTRQTEQYTFDLGFHVNSESILMGQEASILLRPKLMINGRRIDAKNLKQCKAQLVVLDFESKETKLTFDNLTFDNKDERILTFQVPVNTMFISLTLDAKVYNSTKKSFDNLSSNKSIDIQHHCHDDTLRELYLRKVDKEYFIYSVGKNGESTQAAGNDIGKKIHVSVRHAITNEERSQ